MASPLAWDLPIGFLLLFIALAEPHKVPFLVDSQTNRKCRLKWLPRALQDPKGRNQRTVRYHPSHRVIFHPFDATSTAKSRICRFEIEAGFSIGITPSHAFKPESNPRSIVVHDLSHHLMLVILAHAADRAGNLPFRVSRSCGERCRLPEPSALKMGSNSGRRQFIASPRVVKRRVGQQSDEKLAASRSRIHMQCRIWLTPNFISLTYR